jgi:AhpD family alkylhydroperoxidase
VSCSNNYPRISPRISRAAERLVSMDEFDRYRADMNEKLLGSNHLGLKRFFALDTQAYQDGALDKRTKELLGLVASIVLRCDDCITYHIKQSVTAGVTRPEFLDVFNVALVVGGSITIPHLRRAVDRLDATLESKDDQAATPHQHD